MTNEEIQKIYKNLEYIEPETVRHLRGEDTPSLQVLEDMVLKIIEETDAPFQDFYVFENVVQVLNGLEPDTGKLEGVAPEEIWYALDRMEKIVGKEDFGLSPEVETYIRFIFEDNGMIFLPPQIKGDKNPNLKKVLERYKRGSLMQSDTDVIENQAIYLGRILHYMEKMKENK